MRININSWHYKLMDVANVHQPKGLCAYPWMLLWALVKESAILLWFGFLGWVAFTGVILSLWHLFTLTGIRPEFMGPMVLPVMIVTMLTLFIIIATVVFLPIVGYQELSQRRRVKGWVAERDARENGTYVEPEPSIIMEYIKAKHSKVCPRITYVLGEKL